MSMELSRDVVDVGIRFSVKAPEEWLEYPKAGALLTLGGDLGQPEDSLRPSVQWSVIEASDGPEVEFARLRRSLLELPEAVLLKEAAGTGQLPYYTIGVAFRSAATGGAQIALVHAQYAVSDPPVVLQAFASCGGAAGETTLAGLSDIVRSTEISPIQAP
jgi:hypothetical protein